MASQKELDKCYMAVADAHAALSKAKRTKVGVCLVTQQGVLLGGTNGLAPGSSNDLEYIDENGNLATKPEVIHGELNAVLKAAREGVSLLGATLYSTLSCCKPCSEMVAAAGVGRVVYRDTYRDSSGIDNLVNLGLLVEKYSEE